MRLVFNELSLNDGSGHEEGISCFKDFLITYSKAMAAGFDRAVLTYVDMNLIPLARDYYSIQWRNRETDRDIIRRYQGLCDRQQICDDYNELHDVQAGGKSGKGLLCAFLQDEVALSMRGQGIFENLYIECLYFSMEDGIERDIDIFNISRIEDIENNIDIWKARKKAEYEAEIDRVEFLGRLTEYYPTLEFGSVALNQLKNEVEQQHLKTIRMKLYELENVFADWGGGRLETAMFRSKMTPQSKETLKRFQAEHTFRIGGKTVLASYHIRYTGKVDGRIYFYPDRENKKCYICSLTTKLPTVSETKKNI